MATLKGLMDLHSSFNNRFGIGDNLIHYLAQPKIDHSGFNFEEAKTLFRNRQNPGILTAINAAPQDVLVFKKRYELLANNNEAYRIASSTTPSIEELIAFSFIVPRWSIIFPLKHYLMHHWDKAKQFTGFLPFGSAVIAFVNSLESRPRDMGSNPDYADHVYLQTISNEESRIWGIPSIEINNRMYLDGKKCMERHITNQLEDKGWEEDK
jgi:hypothetical protein